MGKSPGKWIKTVLFGKKSSKSNLSKDTPLDKKTSMTINSQSKNLDANSTVIRSPVRHIINLSGERTQLEKTSSASLMHDTAENVRNTLGLNAANGDELMLYKAATKAQAAFRGYLARRSFWALKGIIRLQALVRGHLVRRQAVATLICMRAIVEFQALARGQRVGLSGNGSLILHKRTSREPVHKKRSDLLQTSLKSEKLSTNAFGVKLVASSNTTMPLNIQYDPAETNSVRNWLERWSSSHFWEPLPRSKKNPDVKQKRKQTNLQSQETETEWPKRSVRKVPSPNLYNSQLNSSENEKPKRTARKVSTLKLESVQDQSHSELEKVKRSLRKISVSAAGGSEKSPVEKVNDVNVIVVKQPNPEALLAPPLEDKAHDIYLPVKPQLVKNETSEKVKNMAATESAKAKLRAQAAARVAEDGAENGFVRRHSLPSSTGKLSLESPRVQKSLQVNGKGMSKINKPQISPRDGGWR